MSSLLQAEDLLYKKYPAFSVHFDEYFGVFFIQHLLKIRMIPSPVKHKQTKHNNKFIEEGTCFQVPGSYKTLTLSL